MNLLWGPLPTWVEIDNQRYRLNTDFRVGLRLLMAYEDQTLTPWEQQSLLLRLLYDSLPATASGIQKAVELGLRFLEGGHSAGAVPTGPRLYSFRQDAPLIFSGMLSSHGIDLSRERDLHWWKFCALFQELDEACTFNRIVCLRRRLMQGTATADERRLAAVLGPVLSAPPDRGSAAQEAQAAEFFRLLQKGHSEEEEQDV